MARQLTGRMREMGRRATASRRGPQSGPRHGRDETGAVLVLALIFLLVAGVIIGSLVSWSSNDLLNTSNLQGARSLAYSAGGATDVAIQSARYTSPDSLTTALTAGQAGITQLTDSNGLNAPISAGDQVTIGSGATAQTVTDGLHFLRMDGKETFKNAVQAMCSAANEVLTRCEIDITKIKCVIPHQANRRIIDAVGKRLGATPEQLFVNLHKYGNTSAASVAIALDEAVHSGKIQRGDLVLMVAFGAGLTWGAAVIEW